MQFSTLLFTLSLLSSTAFAHPGSHEGHDIAKRAQFLGNAKRSIADCSETLKARGIESGAIARREALANSLREKRAIKKRGEYLKARDVDTVLNTDHHSNTTGLTSSSDPSLLFTGDLKCVLQPETTQGPYYVNGELIRSDIREDQEGVDLYADIQVIDVNTCTVLPNVYLDFWHCNSTGVYSGVVASGNGDSSDTSNLDKTFGRGLVATDEDGVAQFLTIFPGHYTSRATHIHVLATQNATVLANNTLSGGEISHVGQLFFDQDLITEVELTEPYASNTQELTLNSEDQILSGEADSQDPVFEYVLLGDTAADGILAWISIGIDATESYSVSSAATYYADGGVMNDSGSVGGGMGGDAPSGSGAPGSAPTGSGAPSS